MPERVVGFFVYFALIGLGAAIINSVSDLDDNGGVLIAVSAVLAVAAEVKSPAFADNYHEDW